MSASIGVVRLRPGSGPDRPVVAEMDRASVVGVLRRLFGDAPELTDPAPEGDAAELVWEGERRVGSLWTLYFGAHGLRRVAVSVWDDHPVQPVDGFRAELAPVVEVLRDLAGAADARLFIDGGDVTGAPADEVLDLLA